MINIVFVLPNLECGGAEQVFITLLNKLNRAEFNISLVVINAQGPLVAKLPDDIKMIDLATARVRRSLFKLIRVIRKLMPDIVIAHGAHLHLPLAVLKIFTPQKIKYIARQSSVASLHNRYSSLAKFAYHRFTAIICQSDYMRRDLIQYYSVPQRMLHLINNPVDIQQILQKAQVEQNLLVDKCFNLLAVVRLSFDKNLAAMLDTMQKLQAYPDIKLSIIGDGPERAWLLQQIKFRQLSNSVRCLGYQDNPYRYIQQADLMILTSQYEGFPNVVLEAHACGKPVVTFNSPGGIAEIIIPELNGLLVELGDATALARAILQARELVWDPKQIQQTVYKRYNCAKIVGKYEELFKSLAE